MWYLARTLKGMFDAHFVHRINHRPIDPNAHGWTQDPLLRDPETLMRERLSGYEQRLRLLARKTRAFGAEPVFVTPPSRYYRIRDDRVEGLRYAARYDGHLYNGVDYYRMKRDLDGVTLRVCEEVGGICVDLGRKADWDDQDFYDLFHMTPSGAHKVGELLCRELRPRIAGSRAAASAPEQAD
jgi:hypothetical protein